MFEQIMRIGEKDILIGISFPRYLTQTVKAFQFAKGMAQQLLQLPTARQSPLAQDADHLLLARSDMASFVDSLVAPLSLINALIVAVGLKKQDDICSTFARLEAIWDEYEVYEKSDRSKKSMKVDVLVIGGGPAGMIAAGTAAENGTRVLMLEKNESLAGSC
jgi:uncharacterized FAD-dependent dehydrogenase